LIALADAEPLVKELFDHRFKEGSFKDHSFGNLFIMAMAEVTGDMEHAVRESGRVLAVRGDVLPSTLQDVVLCATVNGGTVIGETDDFKVSDFMKVLEDHVGSNIFDFAIVNSNYSYTPTGGQTKVLFDARAPVGRDMHFILADVVNKRIPSHHDTEKLSKVIMKR